MKISNQSLLKKSINKIISPWLSVAIIDRWLLGQIIPPMIFAISAFTVISLSVGVMFDLIRKIVEYGLPILQALQALIYPFFLSNQIICFNASIGGILFDLFRRLII